MINLIVASHGEFAKGIVQSVTMIAGPQKNVAVASLEPKMKSEDFYQLLSDKVASFPEDDDIIFLVDLKGGTPYNQTKKFIENHDNKWPLITGMNLPMLMDAIFGTMFENDAKKLTVKIMKSGVNGITLYPEE